MVNSVLISLLVTEVTSGWSTKLYQAARTQAISSSQTLISLALAIACFIVVFKMIRLSYDIMSDEQQAGFGGVRLSQILRPVIILVLIQSCPYFVGAFDKIVNSITDNIVASVDSHNKNIKLANVFAEDSAIDNKLSDTSLAQDAENAKLDAEQRANEGYQKIMNNPLISEELKAMYSGFFSLIEQMGKKSVVKGAIREAAKKEIGDNAYDHGMLRKAVNQYWRSYKKLGDAEQKNSNGLAVNISDKNFIPAVCCWLYDRFYLVIQAMAEILLMVLAICAPWMLTFSLIEPYKHVIWVFVGTYIQLSFWKVTAAIINFATLTFRGATVSFTMHNAGELIREVVDSSKTGSDITIGGPTSAAIILSAIVSIAGIFCLMKVGDITAAIIPSPGNTNMSSSVGGAAPVMNTVNLPGKAAGSIVGGVVTMKQLKK